MIISKKLLHLKNMQKIACIFLLGLLLLSTFSSVLGNNENYSYQYIGVEKYGLSDGATNTAIMQIKDAANNVSQVYCIDKTTEVKGSSTYSISNLEDSNYFTQEASYKIRNIVLNSYPFISLNQVRTLTGISNLTEKEAIAGTQVAIWNYSNTNVTTNLTGNAKTLLNWYLALPNNAASTTPVGTISISQETSIVNNKVTVDLLYKTTGKNIDGSDVSLKYKFNKDLVNEYNAIIQTTEKDANGYNHVIVSNLPRTANFNFSVSGKQNLANNVYFYQPKGGITFSQSLVGVNSGITEISNSIDVNINESSYNLTIKKLDSKTLTAITGAEFAISTTKDFSENVYTLPISAEGTATFSGLQSGTWYLQETKTPTGYIPSSEIYEIYINKADVIFEVKNSKFGTVELNKIDENSNPVEGAQFSLYTGATVTAENLIGTEYFSDSNGKLIIPNLLPGNYTLVETSAPTGYSINSKFLNFDITAYDTTLLTHVNTTTGKASISLKDLDVLTLEQLGGAKFGIYTDENYQNLVAEVTSDPSTAILTDELNPGTYYIKQLTAPKGYLLDSAPQSITIEKNQAAELTFYNSKTYATAGNYSTYLIIGLSLFTISLVCFGATKLASKKCNNQ